MDPPPPPTFVLEGGEGQGVAGNQPAIPDDGYEWKKYGKKYIRSIGKTRSYFKCRNRRCRVKKTAEWPPSNPSSNLRIVYHGTHNHPERSATEQEASGSTPNPYDLVNQVLDNSANP